jgi:hypothetical protein
MKRSSIIIAFLLFGSLARAQPGPDVRVVSEDARSLVVELTASVSTRQVLANDGRTYARFDFQGAIPEQGKEGSPYISYRALLIDLPARQYRLEVVASDFKELPGLRFAAFPKYQRDKELGAVAVNVPPREEFMTAGFLPQTIAQLADVGGSRGLILGTLKLFPVQVSPATGVARIYSRIVVRIEFTGAAAATQPASLFLKSRFPSNALRSRVQRLAKRGADVGDSPLAQGDWYKMEVKQTGIYKLDQAFFAQAKIALSAIGDINSIRIFGNGAEELPEDLTASRPDGLVEVPRLVVDKNANGALDAEDFILFYGKSTRGWKYDPLVKTFHHYIDHYTETSNYFLTFGGPGRGKDMAALPSTNNAGAYQPPDFQEKAFTEDELVNSVNSGRQWLGELFNADKNVNVFVTSVPGVVTTKPVVYRLAMANRSATYDSFSLQENGVGLGSISMGLTDLNIADFNPWTYQAPVGTFARTGDLPNDQSVLRIQYLANNSAAEGWLDWFEILYRRRFEAGDDLLLFAGPDTTSTAEFTVSKLSSRDVYVFDVTKHDDVRQITNLTFDPANASLCTFQAAQTAGSVREYAVVGPQGFKTPENVQRISNSNLHAASNDAQFIIITAPDFASEAERLAAYREQHDQLKSLVVTTDQIFNEFSVGMLDPIAIRDFLRYARTSWSDPVEYVLLFGAGSYDYKKIKYQVTNWVPPYETLESNSQIYTLASDDYYVMLDPASPRISLPIGRLPVHSVQEAKDVVDKIIAYETSSPLDSWRDRITFVADDGLTSTGDDGSTHTYQSDQLAELYTPNSFQKEKIYLIEYPAVITSTGRRMPTVNQAIVDAINRGTLVLNWTGHGNTDQWAHEKVFADDEDFVKIANPGRSFLCVAATCDYARYDEPSSVSAGEQLIIMPNRGAIGVITPDRVVYSGENAALNQTLYTYLLGQRDDEGRPVRLGNAMWETKQIHYQTNDQKHHLLADPTMRLAMPREVVTVDSINGQDAVRLISVAALQKVTVKGGVTATSGTSLNGFTGRALIEAYDAKQKVVVTDPGWDNFSFYVPGSLIYRGEISVQNGVYQGTFPIPKDVSYADARSRISLYAWSDSTDASGYSESISIAGSAPASADTVGPVIAIHLEDAAFRPGDVVKPDPLLIVDLVDDSGINTSTAGIGHSLQATLDNASQPLDLTDYYRGNLDTYQFGQVRYQLSDLPEGRHTLSVKAWDIYNNPSTAQTFFEVRAGSQLAIYDIFNVPNPFGRSTTFTFQRTSVDPIDVEIKIYTVAGRLIQTIEAPSIIDRFVEIPWDGRDRDGNELANGVYFYKVIAKSLDGSSTSEALGKLAVLR